MRIPKIISKNKKQIFHIRIKTFVSMMFLTITSGCSFFYEGKDLSRELKNKLNREIIENFSKAILKNPDNFLFYLERGKAKHDIGDYVGAIMDFNSSLSINPDIKVIFDIAKSKYTYGAVSYTHLTLPTKA